MVGNTAPVQAGEVDNEAGEADEVDDEDDEGDEGDGFTCRGCSLRLRAEPPGHGSLTRPGSWQK